MMSRDGASTIETRSRASAEMTGRRRSQAWVALGSSGLALVLIWRLLPSASPPIYDGVCYADPYRYIGGSPPPTAASTSYSGSEFPAAEVQTGEYTPQAQILMMAGTFTASSAVTVSITPVAAPLHPPSGKVQDGNAYHIIATAGAAELQPASGDPATVLLRETGANSSVAMYVYSGNRWQELTTFVTCVNTLEAVSPKLGYFALFGTAGSSRATPSGGFPAGIVVGVLGALVVVATLGLARLAAGRRP